MTVEMVIDWSGGGQEIMGKEYKQDYRWRPRYSNKNQNNHKLYCNIVIFSKGIYIEDNFGSRDLVENKVWTQDAFT